MAEATPIPATVNAYEHARGEGLDGQWAFAVSWRLLMKNVDATLVDEGLREALELVRETGESPEELFGSPGVHAAELFERWRRDGRLNPAAVKVPTSRSLVASSLKASGWIAFIMFVLELVGGRDLPVGFFALPLLLGFATIGGVAFWEWASHAWATALVVTVMTAATVGIGAATVGVLEVTSGTSLGALTPWLLLLEAAVLWSAGTVVLILVTAKTFAEVQDNPDDEQWVRRFSGVLRGPGWQSDARVREIVREARSHAAESGRTLAAEFGPPDAHAMAYGVDVRRRTTLKIALYAVLVALNLVPMVDGFSWATTAVALFFTWQAWQEYRTYDRFRSSAQVAS
ncbi:hypothetical protein GCM10009641_36260 [Mycobacterium cookii]|uniref:Uncharacterized protein n=1 Tax=Nocardioides furvisabuli TaxID=375542 RepID=A0ABP5IL28_9ACTN|nr:hypothetical protein [Nocardioides furvisabuli]